tara:strand:+ start:199 stop:453 length:255 start_codon:yes stop_codon:yes gene_type:complete
MSKSRNNALSFSSVGSIVLENGETATGKFGAVQCITATEFTALTAANIEGVGLLIGYTIPAGTVLYGEFTNVQVNTGVSICHKY